MQNICSPILLIFIFDTNVLFLFRLKVTLFIKTGFVQVRIQKIQAERKENQLILAARIKLRRIVRRRIVLLIRKMKVQLIQRKERRRINLLIKNLFLPSKLLKEYYNFV